MRFLHILLTPLHALSFDYDVLDLLYQDGCCALGLLRRDPLSSQASSRASWWIIVLNKAISL
jgi:hypothetical protein